MEEGIPRIIRIKRIFFDNGLKRISRIWRAEDANGHSRLSAYRLAERSAIISESLLNIEIFAEYNFGNCLKFSTFAKTNYRLLQWKRL